MAEDHLQHPSDTMEGDTESQALGSKREAAESGFVHIGETTSSAVALAESAISQKGLGHPNHDTLDEKAQSVAQDSGYNSSGSSIHQSPRETLPGQTDDDDVIRTRSRASSRTSISSIPASILTNLPDGTKPLYMRDTHDYGFQPWDSHGARPLHKIRQREATFRKPSSVRAMQMHTEDEGDDDVLTPPKRRGSQRISDISIRSAGSSPLKRSPFYSPTGQVSKPKVKKEYPLVLLHCTLLSPSLPVPGLAGHPDRQKILRDILPSVYWKRWKLLEEKIGSGVLRDRGVLISHPEDMYDILEERLLESLELQRPRLDHGHFLGPDETESDREDRLAREDSGTEDEAEECPDCGGRVAWHNNSKKWEIKVFAANGLMRAGAWAAAWKEMEKVDVEVGLWLPSDIRAKLEKCLVEVSSRTDNSLYGPSMQRLGDVVLGEQARALTPSRSTADSGPRAPEGYEIPSSSSRPTPAECQKPDMGTSKSLEEIDLQTLLINYIRVLASDRRNVAILFLSILAVFGAVNSRPVAPLSDLRPFPGDVLEYPISSADLLHTTETWTETPSAEILTAMSSGQAAVLAPTTGPEAPILEEFPGSEDFVRPSESPQVEPEELLPATAEAPSAESIHTVLEEPGQSGSSETSPLDTELQGTAVPVAENTGSDHESPAYGQQAPETEQDEQGAQGEPTEPGQPSESIEPTELNERTEGDEQAEPGEPTGSTIETTEPVGSNEALEATEATVS